MTSSNSKSSPPTYPSLYVTTSNEMSKVNDLLRLLKEDLKPSISYTVFSFYVYIAEDIGREWYHHNHKQGCSEMDRVLHKVLSIVVNSFCKQNNNNKKDA